jgi:6-pyruvoyltetrahydropterin/6-carboxytetrahydropterin synthase
MHGHNYRVRVWVEADELDELGMVIDFADLRRVVGEVLDPLDHRVINEIPPFDRVSTSAERVAEYVHREVRRRLVEPRVRVGKVEVWESDGACAVYRHG